MASPTTAEPDEGDYYDDIQFDEDALAAIDAISNDPREVPTDVASSTRSYVSQPSSSSQNFTATSSTSDQNATATATTSSRMEHRKKMDQQRAARLAEIAATREAEALKVQQGPRARGRPRLPSEERERRVEERKELAVEKREADRYEKEAELTRKRIREEEETSRKMKEFRERCEATAQENPNLPLLENMRSMPASQASFQTTLEQLYTVPTSSSSRSLPAPLPPFQPNPSASSDPSSSSSLPTTSVFTSKHNQNAAPSSTASLIQPLPSPPRLTATVANNRSTSESLPPPSSSSHTSPSTQQNSSPVKASSIQRPAPVDVNARGQRARQNNRDASSEDGDELDDLMGLGLGTADDEGDAFNDDDETPEQPEGTGTKKGGNPRRELPQWLQEEVSRKIEWLKSTKDGSNLYATHRPLRPLSSTVPVTPQTTGLGSFFLPRNDEINLYIGGRIPTPAQVYNPRFFFWDPLPIVNGGIKCPNSECSSIERLGYHGWVSRPRRVVDFDENVYLLGGRYICNKGGGGRGGGKGGCGKTYTSWSPTIIRSLPPTIQHAFPFHLTHRSGCTTAMLEHLRLILSNSASGATHFSYLVRTQHLRRFDTKALHYTSAVHEIGRRREDRGVEGRRYPDLGDYANVEKNNGFVPSAPWFTKVYNTYIQNFRPLIEQHTSMLSLDILALDHSFKIPKRMVKINGVSVFSALHSTTNKKGQLRTFSLVAGKSQVHFREALVNAARSLEKYGHSGPKVAFTDDVASDKALLESIYPSLTKNIAPTPSSSPYAHLSPYTLGQSVTVVVIDSTEALSSVCNAIISAVAEDSETCVGFDAEWNVEVERTGAHERFIASSKVGVVQVAYKEYVYVIQLAKILRLEKSFPQSFSNFLSNPLIRKLGVQVQGDLTKVANQASSVGSKVPSTAGALDLATRARDLGVSSSKKLSLEALCAALLDRHLSKPETIRVSSLWEDDTLSQAAIDYAALDAIVSLDIYQKLQQQPILAGSPIPRHLLVSGTPILLYQTDLTTQIARGRIHSLPPSDDSSQTPSVTTLGSDHPRLTKNRIVVEINQILNSAAFVPGYEKKQKGAVIERTLRSLATAEGPFLLVVKQDQIRMDNPAEINAALDSLEGRSTYNADEYRSQYTAAEKGKGRASEEEIARGLEDRFSRGPAQRDTLSPPPSHRQFLSSKGIDFDNLTNEYDALGLSTANDYDDINNEKLDYLEVDEAAQSAGHEAFADLSPPPSSSDPYIALSRVLLDLWHAMDRIKYSKTHGAKAAFARSFADALFVFNPDDLSLMAARAEKLETTWQHLFQTRRDWFLQRVRRHVPSPAPLFVAVREVFEMYGPLKDAKTGRPLFDTKAWQAARRLLEDIKKGYLSDPPDVELYVDLGPCRGVDGSLNDGVRRYRCVRGTNSTEGGVHQNLVRRFGVNGVAPEHAELRLIDYMWIHNLNVGTYNTTGKPWVGHLDPILYNNLQAATEAAAPWIPAMPLLQGWTNTTLYEPTEEQFGILPLPKSTRDEFNLLPSSPPLSTVQPSINTSSSSSSLRETVQQASRKQNEPKVRHRYLASRQGTKFAVLDVSSIPERALYDTLSLDPRVLEARPLSSKWDVMAKNWNLRADGVEIFYKLPSHLQAYESHRNKSLNIKASLSTVLEEQRKLLLKLRSPNRYELKSAPPTRQVDSLKAPSEGLKPVSLEPSLSRQTFRLIESVSEGKLVLISGPSFKG